MPGPSAGAAGILSPDMITIARPGLVPFVIAAVAALVPAQEKAAPVFVDGQAQAVPEFKNSRDWIHVADHCRALEMLLVATGEVTEGEIFNIAGDNERDILQIADVILTTLEKPASLIRHVTDRPGHDRRYALNATKIGDRIGFEPEVDFEGGLAETIRWYQANRTWWERIKSGAFRDYYDQMYGNR